MKDKNKTFGGKMENEPIILESNMREIFTAVCDESTGAYCFKVPSGGNIAEVIFAIAGFMKVLNRDGITTIEEFKKVLENYLTDVQYEEIRREDN